AIIESEAQWPHGHQVEIETDVVPVHLRRDLIVAEPLLSIRQVHPAFGRQVIVTASLVTVADRRKLGLARLVLPLALRLPILRVEETKVRHDATNVGVTVAALQIEQQTP